MRRRSNPATSDWLFLGAVGVGAYLLYRFLTTTGSAATQSVSSGIANFISKLTLPPAIAVSTAGRQVAMPDGTSLPLSSFTNLKSNPDGSPTLVGQYGSASYTIDSDGQGNYFAY